MTAVIDETTDPWFMPSKDELDNSEYESAPLSPEDYIVKIAKITIGLEPSWNQAANKFDHSKLELQYKMICLPMKLKAEDGLLDTQGRNVKPLTQWLWRQVNPFSIGFNKQGEPTFLRSVIMYCNGITDPNAVLPMPGVIVLNPDNTFATENDAKMYKEQFLEVKKGDRSVEDFLMQKQGFKHIPDIRGLEGKYIGVKLTLDAKGRNKITAFSKVPTGFVPDTEIEAEAMPKFQEAFAKLQAKRDTENQNKAVAEANTAPAGEVTIDDMVANGDIAF